MVNVQTVDGKQITVGMDVWLYPDDEKRYGKITHTTVREIRNENQILVSDRQYIVFLGEHYWWRRVYSSEQAAHAAREYDKTLPTWYYGDGRIGSKRFRIAAGTQLSAYLCHMTGIPKQNIRCHSTGTYVHVTWHGTGGLGHERFQGGYHDLKEETLTPLVAQMKG